MSHSGGFLKSPPHRSTTIITILTLVILLTGALSAGAQGSTSTIKGRVTNEAGENVADADVISLHCPGGAATRHLIDAARLARMKPTAVLVNTARGSVVDEPALAEALAARRIAAAGLDVFENEPRVHPASVGPRFTASPRKASFITDSATPGG